MMTQIHRVSAPVVVRRAVSADDEKPLCSFYNRNNEDDSNATYSSVTDRMRNLQKTAMSLVDVDVMHHTESGDNDDATKTKNIMTTILHDSNVCLTVTASDKNKILSRVIKSAAQPTTPTCALLFIALQSIVALECIRQEQWMGPLPHDVLENLEQLLESAGDAKAKSILKVSHLELRDTSLPPRITMEHFSRELRVAERRLRMLSFAQQHSNERSEKKVESRFAPQGEEEEEEEEYTVESFVDRSRVKLNTRLPIALMKNSAPAGSVDRPRQSPRAEEYLNRAMNAMPGNSAIIASLRSLQVGKKF